MVVRVENLSAPRKYVGNGQTLKLYDSYSSVLVVGNNCDVEMCKNEGGVKIVGDGCRLRVNSGCGSVDFVGNNGRLELASECQAKLTCIGSDLKTFKLDGGHHLPFVPRTAKALKTNSNCMDICNENHVHISFEDTFHVVPTIVKRKVVRFKTRTN